MGWGVTFEMTASSLTNLCRQQRRYASCPELNEVLHLHHKGIVSIQNLDEYTGLKTLHLQCNAISKIQGLDCLVNLRCLHLNQNLVEEVEGLEHLKSLENLDLSENQIKCVKGLSGCLSLRQLNLSGNQLCLEEDVAHLSDCKSLVSLDIARNAIDNERALEVLRSLPLSLLKLTGNPIVSKTLHYRKMTVVRMSMLTYLDDSPVSDKERRLAKAWFEGGFEAETLMRETIREEEAGQRDAHNRAFEAMIQRVTREMAAKAEEENRKRSEQEKVDSAGQEVGTTPEEETGEADQEQHLDASGAGGSVSEEEEPSSASASEQQDTGGSAPEPLGEAGAEKLVEEFLDEKTELTPEQLESAEKEREFKRCLQQRMLERAAGHDSHWSSPRVWGTKLYANLWQAAVNMDHHQVLEDEG